MLDDKVIVVTGGAGLLGRRFCNAVAQNAGIAVVADIDGGAAARAAAEIAGAGGGRVDSIAIDITDSESVAGAISQLAARHGRIDAVVNSAYPRNRNYGRKLEAVEYADFCENLSVHLGGYFLVAQQFAAYFCAHGGGNIVNVASIYGTMPPRFEIYADTPMTMPVEYAAIKAGVIQLTRYFAQYFKGRQVRVNCVSPGGILDGQPEPFLERYNAFAASKGMLDPDDLCGTLLFLLSDMSKFVDGQNIVVDDGWSL
ncbi:MAG: Flagellin modification protein [Betaproteobacteria bacterium]|nr:Flagellin modification protein [Betaproteobacteria bacterium]